MVGPALRSLDVIALEAQGELDAQLRHFEALDSKAGVLLGFAGALVALAPRHPALLILSGRLAAVGSGMWSLSTFWPRTVTTTNLRHLRDSYLAADPAFTRLRLLDTQIGMAERLSADLQKKARRFKLAMISLAIAVLLIAAGLAVS
jgi:hypothetical protein